MRLVSGLAVRAMLFTDIEGSTSLVRRLGDRYEGVLERHNTIIQSAITARAGVEHSREGDSLFATFPTTSAALESALEAQCRIEQEPWPSDGRVRVRMGVHVGEVAESRAGLVGLAIHQAARIMSVGHGGQIVISADVVDKAGRLPPGTSVRSLGIYELRDIGRVPLYQVEHPDLQGDFPRLRTYRAAVHNAPVPATSLVGRTTEARAVSALLDEHRLVTLLGEGGCGKTRLALHVIDAEADRHQDGVWLVDLAPVPAGEDVAARVAQALAVQGGLDEVITALENRDMLLLLDNCEHVIESVSAVVARLIEGSATTTVLATSRAPLDVAGEARYQVPSLEGPRRGTALSEVEQTDAVRLFTKRAAMVRPGFQLGERDTEAIVELCTRLDGVPLAIELAAARLRGMSLAELLARFDDRFGVLVGGPRTAPERHRSLRNTMDWSFRLLDADERHVLRHLAAFRGGCDVEGAEAVSCAEVSSSPGVLDVLLRLVDKSLVWAVEVNGATRYRLHEMIREYVLDSTAVADQEAIEERHARWFAALASRLREGPTPGAERAWIRRHDDESDNFRAAAEWLLAHDPSATMRLLIDIENGIDFTLQVPWLSDLLRRAVELEADSSAGDRAHALAVLALIEEDLDAGDPDRYLSEAVDLLDDVDDAVAECVVLSAVAARRAASSGGEPDAEEFAAAIDAADRAGGTFWPIMTRHFLSEAVPPAIVATLNTDALRLAEQLGLPLFAAMVQGRLASVEQFRADSARVLATWRRVAPMLDDDVIAHEGASACFYALAEGEHGELAVGIHLAEDFALRLRRHPHDPLLADGVYSVAAHLHRLAGDTQHAQAALDLAGNPRFDFLGGLALVTRSALHRCRGQPRAAAAVIEPACRHVGFRGFTDIPMRVVEELAAVALTLDQRDNAADLLATAREARQRENKPLNPACPRGGRRAHVNRWRRDGRHLAPGRCDRTRPHTRPGNTLIVAGSQTASIHRMLNLNHAAQPVQMPTRSPSTRRSTPNHAAECHRPAGSRERRTASRCGSAN